MGSPVVEVGEVDIDSVHPASRGILRIPHPGLLGTVMS